ncbi:MAG: choice-of-anchor Q domain-containing protein [Patescibacteria group bacterium]|nr:choice-of-anchor Q domain-containing protein [Patescibacteria group bacterium]
MNKLKPTIYLLAITMAIVLGMFWHVGAAQASPAEITTEAANVISCYKARLNASTTAIGGETIDERGFEWGTSTGVYTASSTETGSFGTSTFSRVIFSFQPSTTYYYRALAHNASGWATGTEMTFATPKKTYYQQGIVLSTDLLSGVSGEAWITGFTATSSVPASTTVGFLFSRDQVNWYNAEGEKDIWDTMASGTASFDLRKFKWATSTLATSSLEFWYKARLTTNIATAAPIVYAVSVEYSDTYSWTDPDYGYYQEGIVLSTDLLSGVSGEAWIIGFTATSSVPASTTVGFLFSVDQLNWYNSEGEKGVWDTMASGTASFDLQKLKWATSTLGTSSLNFYYKTRLTTNIATAAPIVYAVSVEYSDEYTWTDPDYGIYKEGIFTSNILSNRRAKDAQYFGYNLTSLPASTTAQIMFSNDGANYYSSTGTLWQWTDLEAGDHLSTSTGFDLTGMGWQTDLYYKVKLESEGGTTTPVLADARAWFTERDPVEFTCIIDPDSGTGADYSSLSAWEAAVNSDLTATTTLVFSYNPNTASGTMPDGWEVIGATSGATGTLAHMTGTTSPATSQLMIKDISNGYFQKGEKIYLAATSSYYVYTSSSGDTVIAVAKCRSTGGSADTTAVDISGWSTASTTYIKIWTDPDDVYGRHQGKWDESKYRLIPGVHINRIVISGATDVTIDGLQIETYGKIAPSIAISYNTAESDGNINISSCILRDSNLSTASYHRGFVNNGGSGTTIKLWNNIIYDFNSGTFGGCGVKQATDDQTLYAYNNTIYNCTIGFDDYYLTNGKLLLINNITQNCGNGYEINGANIDSASDYNISDDGTAPGDNSITSATVQFLDTANDDFHLSPNDTSARNAGVSLFNDATSSFSTDIDGTARGSAWDIGADEVPVEFVSTICQADDAGGDCEALDYHNLSNWEDGVECNLTASSTRVFSGNAEGTLNENADITLIFPDYATTSITAKVVATTSDQILVDTISGTSTPLTAASGSKWYIDDDNYWLISGATTTDNLGASPIAIAKIDGAWSASDTVAVDIDHWTTDPDNYIKIYTTDTARHKGKWSYTDYRLVVTHDYALFNNENYIRIDGLQIDNISTVSGSNRGVIYNGADSENGSDFLISNNIIRAQYSGTTNAGAGIQAAPDLDQNNEIIKIYNNIIYDIYNTSNHVAINIYDGSAYIFNNTVYNSRAGINSNSTANDDTKIMVNNIVQCDVASSSFEDYIFVSNFISSYNIASDDTSPNNEFDNITIDFADAANDDFHLAETDTVAINAGVDLSSTSTLSFLDDIDGGTRNGDDKGWDIGADEVATKIYRSVGNDSSDLKNAASVTISGFTATFSAGQPDNVGVGDVIQYGTSTQLAFITGRASSTEYSVQAWDGKTPSATSSAAMKIFRAFSELDDWEDNLVSTVNSGISDTVDDLVVVGQDLVSSNTIMMVPCYYASTADNDAVYIDGWTTGSSNYIKVYTPYKLNEAGVSQRHTGKWIDSAYKLGITNSYAIQAKDNYVRIDGLQISIDETNGTSQIGIRAQIGAGDSEYHFSNNLVKGNVSNSYDFHNGIRVWNAGSGLAYVYNNIIYDFTTNGIALSDNDFTAMYAYNNTVYNCGTGISQSANTRVNITNNIAQKCNDGFSGTFDASSDYNISDISQADADDVNASFNGYKTVEFVDSTNNDFHLAPSDTAAIDAGVNLSTSTDLSFTDDIDGHYRRQWDIGADEASVEFVSTIMESGGAFSSLSLWETANQVDLTATTTAVFSCSSATGTIPVGSSIIGLSSENLASSTVMSTSSNQILLYNIGTYSSATSSFSPGERLYIQGGATTSNYCILSNLGNPAIAVAKIDGAWASADTNAVSIYGWTTGKYNYIRVYTTDTARHNGVWDDNKYRLEISQSLVGSRAGISISEKYCRINGLQIKKGPITIYSNNKCLSLGQPSGEIWISNNVCQIVNNSTYSNYGIYESNVATPISTVYKIWNNIIYDAVSIDANRGIGIIFNNSKASTGHVYIYNNTITNSYIGICANGIEADVINNIVECDSYNSNFMDYWDLDGGYFVGNSGYNISSDGTAPGLNALANTAASFRDAVNDDFRLDTTDTAAKNAGIDLSADANLNFTDDIEGQARYDTNWDIGADEAPTIHYRSIGRHEYDLNSGDESVSISTTTATFSGNLAANIGIGDAIEYGNPLKIAFITARNSSSSYEVAAWDGSLATATTTASSSVYRSHLKLDDWEDHQLADNDVNPMFDSSVDDYVVRFDQNLVASNTAMFVPCYASTSPDNKAVAISGWDTATSSYIKIYTPTETTEVGTSQRHSGIWDENKYRLNYQATDDSQRVIWPIEDYVRIEGLQIYAIANDYGLSGISITTGSSEGIIYIFDNIIKSDMHASGTAAILMGSTPGTAIIVNNIIYDWKNGNKNMGAIHIGNSTTNYIYNNTIYNSYKGIYRISGATTAVIKNNAVFSNVDDFALPGGTITLSHNASDDLDGTNPTDISPADLGTEEQAWKAAFQNYANYDFRIRDVSSVLLDAGATITIVGDDILGNSRPQGKAYDIGAFEMLSSNLPKYIIEGPRVQFEGHVEFK